MNSLWILCDLVCCVGYYIYFIRCTTDQSEKTKDQYFLSILKRILQFGKPIATEQQTSEIDCATSTQSRRFPYSCEACRSGGARATGFTGVGGSRTLRTSCTYYFLWCCTDFARRKSNQNTTKNSHTLWNFNHDSLAWQTSQNRTKILDDKLHQDSVNFSPVQSRKIPQNVLYVQFGFKLTKCI